MSQLRDIRPDLRDRLALAERQSAKLTSDYEAELKAIQSRHSEAQGAVKGEIASLKRLLAAEDARLGEDDSSGTTTRPDETLADFIYRKLSEKSPRTKDELKNLALEAGFFQGQEPATAGRSTHATLVNLVRSNRAIAGKNDQFAKSNLAG